jgi:hypothetical protein
LIAESTDGTVSALSENGTAVAAENTEAARPKTGLATTAPTTKVQRKELGVVVPKNMGYGVVEDTGSTLPRKKRWPVQTKSAT